MRLEMSPELRVIVDIDDDPSDVELSIHTLGTVDSGMRGVLSIADLLADTGVCLKVETSLAAYGFPLIRLLREKGFRVFADTKAFYLGRAMEGVAKRLKPYAPAFATVACRAGRDAMAIFKDALPDTIVLGVTVPTDQKVPSRGFATIAEEVVHLAHLSNDAGVDGLVLAPGELLTIRSNFPDMILVTPNQRPRWGMVGNDDQNPDRGGIPELSLTWGADYLVVGKPVKQYVNPDTGEVDIWAGVSRFVGDVRAKSIELGIG